MTLGDALERSGGPLRNAADRAFLERRDPADSTQISYLPVRLSDPATMAMKLQPYDQLSVYDRTLYTNVGQVGITGAVKQAVTFDYHPDLTLEDLFLASGGFQVGAALNRVQVFRRIVHPDRQLLSPALAEPIGVTRLLVIAVATILIPPLGTRALLRGHREPPSAQGNRRRRAALRAAWILPLLGLLWLTASGLWSELLSRLPPPLGGLALLGVLTPFLLGWLLSEREVWRAEIRRSGESLSPLGGTLTCARPALLLLAVFVAAETASDLVWLRPDLREMWQTDPGVSALGSLLLLLLLLLITPRILGWIHPRESLPEGTLRERFRETARAAGTGLGRVEVWNTHPLLTLNACVTGLLPGQRRVYFTRGLIERLDEEQLAAVFAHELGHSRLHHFWFHTGLILGIGGIAAGAATLLGTGGGGGTGEDGPVELAIIGGTILFLAFFYGHLSRHFENQADLFSADTLGSPNGITSALHQLATLSGAALRRGGSRHPSILARIDRVLSCTFDPRARRRFEGRTRRLQLLCLLILLVGALGGLSSLRARLEEPEWKR
ncbi:MAG: M48 family metalloprotease, partial [Planctomycetota bacterium]